MFVNVMFTDFGSYLIRRGVSRVYLVAFAYPVVIYLTTDICLKFTVWSRAHWLVDVAYILMLYGVLNFWTLMKNVMDLASLYELFRELHDPPSR